MRNSTSNEIRTVDYGGGTSDLKCPGCGEEYLHQGEVRIYSREKEDDPSVVVSVKDTKISFKPDKKQENPSSRRQGLSIRFKCEHCYAKPILNISQHKGHTQISWDYNV